MSFQIKLFPKQSQLLKIVETSHFTRIGEGGSRGGGKSKTLRDIQLYRRFTYENTLGWLFRRTLEELRDNHIDPLFRDYPGLTEYWKSDTRELTLPNKSKLQFKIGETEGDILKNRGKQAMDIAVDESNLMRESEMRELGMCCRWPGYPEWQCKLLEGFNPGGIGHNRIKRLYVDRQFLTNEVPEMYYFLPIFAWDNAAWSESALEAQGLTLEDYYSWTDNRRFEFFVRHTQYGRELNALPEPTRSQMLLGSFTDFEGQVFGALDDGVHNIDNWLRDDQDWREFLERTFRLTGGLDHATTGIRAYGISAMDSKENWFVLDEVYKRNILLKDFVDEVKRTKRNYPKLEFEYIDPSTESDTQENVYELSSIQDAYRREGLSTVVPQRTKIGIGLDLMNKMLRIDPERRHPFTDELGSPQFFMSRSRCPNGWLEMTELQCIVRDGKIKYVGADHFVDLTRYQIMAHMKPPKEKPSTDPQLMNSNTVTLARNVNAKWARQFDKKQKTGRTYW